MIKEECKNLVYDFKDILIGLNSAQIVLHDQDYSAVPQQLGKFWEARVRLGLRGELTDDEASTLRAGFMKINDLSQTIPKIAGERRDILIDSLHSSVDSLFDYSIDIMLNKICECSR